MVLGFKFTTFGIRVILHNHQTRASAQYYNSVVLLPSWQSACGTVGKSRCIRVPSSFVLFRCEGLAEIIWTMRQQVRQLEGLQDKVGDPTQNTSLLPELLAGITELLSNLVTG